VDPVDLAFELGVKASATSARPLNRKEKRAAVTRLLETQPELSARDIARRVGVSTTTVTTVKRERESKHIPGHPREPTANHHTAAPSVLAGTHGDHEGPPRATPQPASPPLLKLVPREPERTRTASKLDTPSGQTPFPATSIVDGFEGLWRCGDGDAQDGVSARHLADAITHAVGEEDAPAWCARMLRIVTHAADIVQPRTPDGGTAA
jgi:hypothetical protein